MKPLLEVSEKVKNETNMIYLFTVYKSSRFYLNMHLLSTFPCVNIKSETYVQFSLSG